MRYVNIICFVAMSFSLHAANLSLESWPGEFYSKVGSEVSQGVDRAGVDFSDAIFESLTELDLFNLELGKFTLSANTKRRVFDNYDLLQTWTVVDTLTLPGSYPLYVPAPIPLGNALEAQIGLSARIGGRVVNIRQVKPKKKIDLELLKELSEDMKKERSDLLFEKIDDYNENDKEEEQASILPYKSSDPEVYAKYSHLEKLITNAFRIPFNAKRAKKMDEGEIISYSVDGAVELGVTVGLVNPPKEIAEFGAKVGSSIYLGGTYQISVMREEWPFVKVKIGRKISDGKNIFIGTDGTKHVIYEGFLLLGNNVGDLDADVVPLQFSVNEADSTLFDSGFRYDLSKEEGIKAYEKAMHGRFAYSDQQVQNSGSGVTPLFDRKLESKTTSKSHRIQLSYFFEKLHNHTLVSSYATVNLPSGKHKIFKATITNSFGMQILDYFKEEENYRFSNVEDAIVGGETVSTLTLEVNLKDRLTNGLEMARYMNIIENIIHRGKLFEHPPIYDPKFEKTTPPYGDFQESPVIATYGKSSFYLKTILTSSQVEDFALADDLEILAEIERVLKVKMSDHGNNITLGLLGSLLGGVINAPLKAFELNVSSFDRYVAAYDFYRRWKRLKDARSDQDLMKKLQKLFDNRFFSAEYMSIVTSFVDPKELSFSLVASGELFGQILLSGKDLPASHSNEERINAVTEFDAEAAHTSYDENATIKNFNVEIVDQDNVDIKFELNEAPRFFYVLAARTNNWKPHKILTRFIGQNQGLINKGSNSLRINRHHKEGFRGRIARAIFSGDYVTISASMSLDSKRWGAVTSSRFKTKKPSEEEREDQP